MMQASCWIKNLSLNSLARKMEEAIGLVLLKVDYTGSRMVPYTIEYGLCSRMVPRHCC